MQMCSHPLVGQPDSLPYWDNQSKEAHGLILAAVDSHSIGISRTELVQLISVKSFKIFLMQNVDKCWRRYTQKVKIRVHQVPASKQAFTGSFLEAHDTSLKLCKSNSLAARNWQSLFAPTSLD